MDFSTSRDDADEEADASLFLVSEIAHSLDLNSVGVAAESIRREFRMTDIGK